jgi:DNA-binding MarR family transcriptional regulator
MNRQQRDILAAIAPTDGPRFASELIRAGLVTAANCHKVLGGMVHAGWLEARSCDAGRFWVATTDGRAALRAEQMRLQDSWLRRLWRWLRGGHAP